MNSRKQKLTVDLLAEEAEQFCISMSRIRHGNIVGITDGKAIGTYVEHGFKEVLAQKYSVTTGSSAKGIDFPDPQINTDMEDI